MAWTGAARATLRHLAIIMDGNGRWARARGLPRTAGHHRGADAVRRTVEAAARQGIPYLTVFGFSAENWRRPDNEVDELMGLLRRYLQSEIAELHGNNVRLRVVGDRRMLPGDIVQLIEEAENTTTDNTGLTFTVAVNYGGRQDIVGAVQRLAARAAHGERDPSEIGQREVEAELETATLPHPDVIVRTSGEQRLSNFMLWQGAYSEFVFLDKLWPDFDAGDIEAVIGRYHRRERRYGTTAESH